MNSWLSWTLYCHALFTVMHFLLKTEDFVQNRFLILHFWLRKKVYSEENPPLLVVSWHSSAAFLPNFWLFPSPTVQHCCKNTSQLVFLMPPTSPASFVQIGALWIFFLPRVPPLHNFSFLVAQTPTRCKTTSKSLPSLFFWWSPPVLQVSSRLEHFKFFFSQGSPLWIIFPNFDKMQKSCIFCFSRYGPHFLTRYSGLPQEQF